MALQPTIPILYTAELEATITFYCGTLGFSCGEKNEDWGWAALHKDDCEIMLAKPNAHTPFEKPLFTGSFYIKTDDVETLWQQLKTKTNIAYEIETFDWGMREFAIYDNNGYMLQFGQQLDN